MANKTDGREQRESKIAYIESIITDQGNGGSYCSNCKVDLTTLCREQVKVLVEIGFVQSKWFFDIIDSFNEYLPGFAKSAKMDKEDKDETLMLKEKLNSLYICPGCGYNLRDGSPPS